MALAATVNWGLRSLRQLKNYRPSAMSLLPGRAGVRDLFLRATKSLLIKSRTIHRGSYRLH